MNMREETKNLLHLKSNQKRRKRVHLTKDRAKSNHPQRKQEEMTQKLTGWTLRKQN
jgi:hypothetical protein